VARHGVVVDFGSSDSQIIDGVFSEMDQALLDVHGEASRDTLIKGNTLQSGRIGVIVGGGGRAVHCNDGPRHHVIHNRFSDLSTAGVSVSDYTPETFVRSNRFMDNSTHLLVTFGARDVLFEQNQVGVAAVTPITVALDDSAGVYVLNNAFETGCSELDSHLVLGNAEPPRFEGNEWSSCADE